MDVLNAKWKPFVIYEGDVSDCIETPPFLLPLQVADTEHVTSFLVGPSPVTDILNIGDGRVTIGIQQVGRNGIGPFSFLSKGINLISSRTTYRAFVRHVSLICPPANSAYPNRAKVHILVSGIDRLFGLLE
jgi:hypothetical protein